MENIRQPLQDRVGADVLLGATEIADAVTEELDREVKASEVYYINDGMRTAPAGQKPSNCMRS